MWRDFLAKFGLVRPRYNLHDALASEIPPATTAPEIVASHLFIMLNPQLQALGYGISMVPTTPPFTSATCYTYICGLVGGLLERLGSDGFGDAPISDAIDAALFLIYGAPGMVVQTMSDPRDQISDDAVRAHAFGWEEGLTYDLNGPGKPIGFLLAARGKPF